MALPLLVAKERWIGEDAWDALAKRYRIEILDGEIRPALVAGGYDAAAIWTFRERIDAELLDALPSLRAVANYGVGTDTIDRAELERRGIPLILPTGTNAEAVADHTFALLLAARRRVVELDALVRAGGWDEPMAHDLHGSTLGIVGLGATGRAVARRAAAFGLRVLYSAPRRAPQEVERALGAEHVPLGELLARSDAVTLHCPLTPETEGLIGSRELAAMQPHAVLVNAARGRVCDEAALIEALEQGRIAGAGLDVFADEPRVPERLRALRNAVLAPHAADATFETRTRMTRACADGLLAALD